RDDSVLYRQFRRDAEGEDGDRLQSRPGRTATERHRHQRGAEARAALRDRAHRREHQRLSRNARTSAQAGRPHPGRTAARGRPPRLLRRGSRRCADGSDRTTVVAQAVTLGEKIPLGMSLPHRSPDKLAMTTIATVARRAEELGFADLWVTENTMDETTCFDPVVILTY